MRLPGIFWSKSVKVSSTIYLVKGRSLSVESRDNFHNIRVKRFETYGITAADFQRNVRK